MRADSWVRSSSIQPNLLSATAANSICRGRKKGCRKYTILSYISFSGILSGDIKSWDKKLLLSQRWYLRLSSSEFIIYFLNPWNLLASITSLQISYNLFPCCGKNVFVFNLSSVTYIWGSLTFVLEGKVCNCSLFTFWTHAGNSLLSYSLHVSLHLFILLPLICFSPFCVLFPDLPQTIWDVLRHWTAIFRKSARLQKGWPITVYISELFPSVHSFTIIFIYNYLRVAMSFCSTSMPVYSFAILNALLSSLSLHYSQLF